MIFFGKGRLERNFGGFPIQKLLPLNPKLNNKRDKFLLNHFFESLQGFEAFMH
jgi:hypothetical protein